MDVIIIKPSLSKLIKSLGFSSVVDTKTMIPKNAFERLDETLVSMAAEEYKINISGYPVPLSSEDKFEIVNRILELKHGIIIEPVIGFDRPNSPESVGNFELKKLALADH